MATITIKEYFTVPGSLYSNKDAQKIGPVLHELSTKGGMTAHDVVDCARSPQSPLHEYFEWDDKAAADKFRLNTASKILGAIKIRYIEDGEPKESRAFQVQRTSAYEPERRSYRTFEVLHGDTAFAVQMMDSAIDDLRTWRRKYEPYIGMWKNFGDVFQQVINQISEFTEDASTGSSATTDEALASLVMWREEYSMALSLWIGSREQVEFMLCAIKEAEKVFDIVNEAKHRDCMKCGKSFMSVSIGNRICRSCLNGQTVNERNVNVIDAQMIGR